MAEPSTFERRRVEAEILAPVLEELSKEIGAARAEAVLARAVARVARARGEALRREHPAGDLEGVAALWTQLAQGGALALELERGEDSLALRIDRCAYADHYRAQGAERLGRILSCGRDGAVVEGYSSGIAMERTRCLMDGDGCCRFLYTRKR
jgi:L-2-amino-thiazoline-4-carboxylic acid hydrolase-like protein